MSGVNGGGIRCHQALPAIFGRESHTGESTDLCPKQLVKDGYACRSFDTLEAMQKLQATLWRAAVTMGTIIALRRLQYSIACRLTRLWAACVVSICCFVCHLHRTLSPWDVLSLDKSRALS